ncbi:hypothetical protein Y1Q_0016835 [Alligator mississippiensis]|uniref:von Willebrand factor n=1 Tax=Alligator mississippiensis TaxID=8496 RepID=A0A151P744_ALLMI|nr:hypothetical protein Y1Q_0016835 [Alligator mississippiensis]
MKKMIHFLVLLMLVVLPILTSGSSNSFPAEGRTGEPSASRCSLFGDAHIETFDGSFYDFAGDCSYILATDCYKRSFTVLGNYQNGRRNGFSVYLGEYFDIRFSIDGTVTQGNKRISIPFASHGIYLENEAGYYKLSSEEHGFVVKIDISGNIQILLEDKHYNKTCGLCGDFNSFAEDDFRTQEGTLVKNSYDFANSWALDSEDEQCRRVPAPSNTCNISSDMADKDVMQKCQLLQTSLVFSRCHHQIDPEPFINLCEKDMCTCAQDMSCHCPTFLEYARSCAHQGVILDGWPEDSLCRPRCPVGMEYKECISPCAKTCQSLNINEVCRGQCVDGCSCPEGKLLDGDHCVDSSECSCIHSGRHHPPGSSISKDCNFCVCRRGIWICSNEECPGDCSVTGQSHFKSFDNKYFTFSGICQYLFAKDCEEKSFSVIIDTVQCADDLDAVCTRSASVRLKDMENSIIKMKHGGGISLNGRDIQIPLVQGALRIQHTIMSSVRLTYGEDLQIDWDGHGKLLVKLAPVYTERTCGLCGNYNGNQGDDFLIPSGMVEALVEDFGNAWKLNADCQDLLKQDSEPCSFNPRLAKYAEASCSILMSPLFEPCHHEVNPSPYLKNCHYDVCSCSDGKDCLCSAISSYATACARKDVLIKWREPDFCSMSCPEGQVYQQCGTPCNQTCRSLSYPDADCNDFCMEGCYCPPGQYVDEREDCVPKSQCSCYYDGEIFQPDDIFSDHYSMCYCENGFMHCSTNRLPGAFLPDIYFANQPSSRIKRSLTCRHPMDKLICPPNNPGAEGIECAKTCQNYDLECVSHGCISGCLCPKGMVRHETKCIALERCPCFHNGREYSTGQRMTKDCNTCVCRGRKWDCTTNVCDATCSVIGTAHYLTFDGLKYKFPGACQYVLVQDYCEDMLGTFRILISNEGCGFTRDKCTKRVTIFFENGEIELFNGNVNVKTPPTDETGFEVLKSGRYYILLLGKDISVSWDLAMGISVILTEDFQDRVCGLCGNFDGIQNNDLTSSNNHLEVDPVDFGNSWKVNPHCANVKKFNQGQTLISPLCNNNLEKQVMVENSCSILTSDVFNECRKLVNPESYVDICIYDTCTCESIGDCACFCDAIAAYAHICAQKGAVVQWRSPTLCPQSCEHMNKQELEYQCEWRYNSCGPACSATCQHLEPVECPLRCVEGCHVHCPPGKILDELSQRCIDPQDCPVCILEGSRISHGKKIFLNKDDLERCQSCLCEGKNLTCHACEPGEVEERPTPTPTPLPPDEMEIGPVEYSCSKMMDLALLLDGSNKLSEQDFEVLKDFTSGMMKKLHISQKKIRVSVLVYTTASNIYLGLKEIKPPYLMRRMVKNIKYAGGNVASIPEVLKYVIYHVFKKAPRTNAARIAMLFTASKSPGNVGSMFKHLRKEKITVIPIGLGPHISREQINLIESQSPENKAFIMNNVLELKDNKEIIIDYLCGLVREETVSLPPTVAKIIITPPPETKVTVPSVESGVTRAGLCHKPMDVMFLLDGSASVGVSEFEEMKSFIKAFIRKSDISDTTTHIAVLQCAGENTQEISWNMPQEDKKLLDMVDSIQQREKGPTRLGRAIDYAVQHAMTEANGGRPTAVKIAVVLVSERSEDPVDAAARSANGNRVTVFPIGIGDRYDEGQLRTLTGESATDRIIKLRQFENLPSMVTLNDAFVNKLCTEPVQECIDDDGNKRRPGDTWILSDRCHTVTCFPGGHTILENYRINCEKLPKPTCRNDLPAVKLEETCGCHWVCPCRCLGSSTRHIVTFDGLNFKLTGNCSYTMFQDKEHDIEVILHNGACSSTPKINCMNSVEVKHSGVSLKLSSDMTVAVNGDRVSLPYTNGQLEVAVYGAIIHEIRFSHLGHNLTFTPRNNEFTLELSPRSFSSKIRGLCGVCDENDGNDFMLNNGSVTSDSSTFIQEWTVKEPGKVCEVERERKCAEHSATKCSVLLSAQFEECHRIISPNMFYAACQENSCYSGEICEIISSYAQACRTNGICIDWRMSEFCVMNCPTHMIYNHCQRSCIKHCENGTNVRVCKDYPTEGCFCPDGQVTFNSNCVDEEVCTQCISEDGAYHQHMETWISSNEPCKICICLDNRKINCTVRPCPTAQSIECGPCEVTRLRRDSDQCCPEYECVCDLASCDLPPIPDCKDELQPALTNPGECRPNYTCVCKKEMCRLKHIPLCPPHRELAVRKTQCCDEYECTCSCTNLTVNCPSGYLSVSVTNDCGCVTTNCIPDRVCVHHGIVYPIGKLWDEGCTECLCTNMEDAVTGLRIVECHAKPCNKICHQGYTYVQQEGECCGKCQKTACEEPRFWSRGDVDARWYEVGTKWRSPFKPCIVNECVRMNNEVFIQKMNVSCSQMDMPDCQVGTELRCDRIIDCCPSCYCEPVKGCVLNGTIIGVGKRLMVDLCTTCECTTQRGQFRQYRLECRKFSCAPCPKSYRMEEISGSCCGRCAQISCAIRLRNGRIMYLQPNETVQDGCDSHVCKVNEKQEFIWERRITGCPPFDSRRCLAEGGKIAKIDNTCCETCIEAECRPFVSRLKHININDCLLENEVLISHCEGKCQSSTKYTTQLDRWEDQCSCCTATHTEVVEVPLLCVNGTVVQHAVSSALACDCLARKCT